MGGSIGGVRLDVVDGDIATLLVDAVANAANDHLWMGAGVAGALKRAGGPEVEREAVAKGPIATGDAVATTAGHLPARWVIHAAVMGQDLRTSAEIIEQATLSTLRVADELGARSVALPAFGTGVGGFSVAPAPAICAHIRGRRSSASSLPHMGLRRRRPSRRPSPQPPSDPVREGKIL